jgi:hypothetical protein
VQLTRDLILWRVIYPVLRLLYRVNRVGRRCVEAALASLIQTKMRRLSPGAHIALVGTV